MHAPTSVPDLQRLIDNRISESLHLDYKATAALFQNEISKDVSSFANSDGGIIIYGIVEQDHVPMRLDDGVDENKFNREKLENIITSNINPRVAGVEINPIALPSGSVVFSVLVPKTYGHAHQDSVTKKYYKRFNFKSQPMDDYEIEDLRARRDVRPPLVNVDIELRSGFLVDLVVANTANVPAQEITFKVTPEVPEITKRMQPNFITRGIKNLPAGKTYRISIGSSLEILNDDGSGKYPSAFEVEVTYYDVRVERKVSHIFALDVMDYMNTPIVRSELYEFGEKLGKALENLTREIVATKSMLQTISNVTGPTGLNLSVSTMKNLHALRTGNDTIGKIDAFTCSAEAFREVLGVSVRTANLLEYHFRYHQQLSKRLDEVTGMTPELLVQLRDRFITEELEPSPPPAE